MMNDQTNLTEQDRLIALKGVYEKWLTKTGFGYVRNAFEGGPELLSALWLAWTTGQSYGPSDSQPTDATEEMQKHLFDEE
jgi:hypothetical protein